MIILIKRYLILSFVFLLSCKEIVFTLPTGSSYHSLIINHESIDLFDKIPQSYIDEVKKKLLVLPGESHGRAYGYGLELINSQYTDYPSLTNWSGEAEAYREDGLRWNRSYRSSSSWKSLCGEKEFFTSASYRNYMVTGLEYIDSNYTGDIYFGFGWCWDMTWTNALTTEKDPVFGCGWAGSTDGGPEGNLAWGIDDDDAALTGNSVNLYTYLDAVERYNSEVPNIKTIYTTGPVDNLVSTEEGYQRHLKHEEIRDYVYRNGGILFDYADILSWDYANDTYIPESWGIYSWNGRNADLAIGGTGYDGGDGGSHISEEGCLLIGKALWVMMALDSGWDGN